MIHIIHPSDRALDKLITNASPQSGCVFFVYELIEVCICLLSQSNK